jgi:regulator of replication initiation timing
MKKKKIKSLVKRNNKLEQERNETLEKLAELRQTVKYFIKENWELENRNFLLNRENSILKIRNVK